MRKSELKKEMISAYKEQKQAGGVYVIRNLKSGKLFLDSTPNIQGMANRFEFSQKTGSCITTKLQKEWTPLNKEDFVFEILEELNIGENQTKKEFKEDLETLKLLWLEKLDQAVFY